MTNCPEESDVEEIEVESMSEYEEEECGCVEHDDVRRILESTTSNDKTSFTTTGYNPYTDFKYTNFDDSITVAGVTADTDAREYANKELNDAIDKGDLTVDERGPRKSALNLSVSLALAILYILFQ